MAKVFAIANQKGGVGKTTTCINLAASLVATKRRVLLIDLDPQGNATMGSGIDKRELEASITDVLLGEAATGEAIARCEDGYDLLPGNIDLTAAEIQLMQVDDREQRLKSALDPLRDDYDFIIIDCPPALSLLTLNALTAADWKAATDAGVRELPEPEAGAQEWQLWNYSPALVPDANTVDPLSLTISLQENADDRIQLALDELKGQLPW